MKTSGLLRLGGVLQTVAPPDAPQTESPRHKPGRQQRQAFRRISPTRSLAVAAASAAWFCLAAAGLAADAFLVSNHYATVPSPRTLSFGSNGSLFVGRETTVGSVGGQGRIHWVLPGGSPVIEFGDEEIPDPDGVVFDASGVVSGVPGSVIVGSGRRFSRVTPSGVVSVLHTNATFPENPTKMRFENPGRLLFADYRGLGVMTGPTPTQLNTTTDRLLSVAVDKLGRLVASRYSGDASLMLFTSAGASLNVAFAPARLSSPLARGPGGPFWGDDIIAVNPAGQMVRIDEYGQSAVLADGFAGASDFEFGPDGALYVSFVAENAIRRCEPFIPPVVPGMAVESYASVSGPMTLAFAPNGILYVGVEPDGGTGNEPARVRRIVPGTTTAHAYGPNLPDPDAVAFDRAGLITGIPGAVLVGGLDGGLGRLSHITNAALAGILSGPGPTIGKATKFVPDGPGRLLYADSQYGRVMELTNPAPVALFSTPAPYSMALDALGRVLVSSSAEGIVRLYGLTGTLLQSSFALAKVRSPLARGPGGAWSTNVYFVSAAGDLKSISPAGLIADHGTGFQPFEDMVFGPDQALYLADRESGSILRVVPPDHMPVPLHWWRADGDATDAVGGEHGTATAAVGYAPGRFGQAFAITNTIKTDGTLGFASQVTFGTNAGNFGAKDFTVSLWVKAVTTISSNETVHTLLSKRLYCGHAPFWQIHTAARAGAQVDGDFAGLTYLQVGISTNSPKTTDQGWHHVVLVRQGTEVLMYQDGLPGQARSSNFVANANNEAPLTINADVCRSAPLFPIVPFRGWVDDVRLYAVALSPTQVQKLANTDPSDTDGDGIPGPWEIYHGLNPLVQDSGGAGLHPLPPHLAPGSLAFTWHEALNTQGYSARPQWSRNLVEWFDSGTGPLPDDTKSFSIETASTTATHHAKHATLPLSGNGRVFVRLVLDD